MAAPFALAAEMPPAALTAHYAQDYKLGAHFELDLEGSDNSPVQIGDRSYDNSRHKTWDTYFIPTLSLGYSW